MRQKDMPDKDDMILAKAVYLSKDNKISKLNTNSLIIGASGSGKTHSVIEPNLLQHNSNYVINDPGGFLYEKYASFFKKKGYDVKVLDFANTTDLSEKYNPMSGAVTQPDMMQRIEEIADNLTAAEPVNATFLEAEKMLMRAILMYAYETMGNEASISAAIEEFRTENNAQAAMKTYKDKFDMLVKKNPDSAAVKLYDSFRQIGEKSFGSIWLAVAVILRVFDLRDIKAITSQNTIDMENFDAGQNVLFVTSPNCDNTFDPLVSLFYSQFIRTLMQKQRCTNHISFILNDYWWSHPIKDLDVALAIGRSKNYGIMMFISCINQLKMIYPNVKSVIDGCDTIIYLGTGDVETAEYISGMSQYKSKTLLSPAMIMSIGVDESIILISGNKPIIAKKYDIKKHTEYYEVNH